MPSPVFYARTDILEVCANEDKTSVSGGVGHAGSSADRVPYPHPHRPKDAPRRGGDERDARPTPVAGRNPVQRNPQPQRLRRDRRLRGGSPAGSDQGASQLQRLHLPQKAGGYARPPASTIPRVGRARHGQRRKDMEAMGSQAKYSHDRQQRGSPFFPTRPGKPAPQSHLRLAADTRSDSGPDRRPDPGLANHSRSKRQETTGRRAGLRTDDSGATP